MKKKGKIKMKLFKNYKKEWENQNKEIIVLAKDNQMKSSKIKELETSNKTLQSERDKLKTKLRLEKNDLLVQLETKSNLILKQSKELGIKNGKIGGLSSGLTKLKKKLEKSEQEKQMLQNTIQELTKEINKIKNKPTLQEIKNGRRNKRRLANENK